MHDATTSSASGGHRSTRVPVLSLAKWGLGWGIAAWVLPILITSGGGSVTYGSGPTKVVYATPVTSWMPTEGQIVVVIVALGVSLWALQRVHRSHGQLRGKAYALTGAILAGAKLVWLTSVP